MNININQKDKNNYKNAFNLHKQYFFSKIYESSYWYISSYDCPVTDRLFSYRYNSFR